ncbi:hypothetical protein [Leifsonia shinshuensis]|uniref:hypothetical protein n=1 Tax=Leifsonia shinshuensis TaxID=150026 RepID=UPI002859CF9C|nr:hypothetical protein [Leifsonia shinshuensis]MDR6970213.1 hypothetical protein [Leifsonia shinshuensis]
MTTTAAAAERRASIGSPGHLRAAVRDYGVLGVLARSAVIAAACCLIVALASLSRATMQPDGRTPLVIAAVFAACFVASALVAVVGSRAVRRRAERDFAVFRERGWVAAQVPLDLGDGRGSALGILTHPGFDEMETEESATRIERRLASLSPTARVVTVHRLRVAARRTRPVGGFVPELPPETLLTNLLGDRRRVVVLPGDPRRGMRILPCGPSSR